MSSSNRCRLTRHSARSRAYWKRSPHASLQQLRRSTPSGYLIIAATETVDIATSSRSKDKIYNVRDLFSDDEELQDNSDESDFDPETPAPAVIQSAEIDDIHPEPDSDSDEEHVIPAVTEQPMLTKRSTRVRQAPVSFKTQARQTTNDRYNHDDSFRTTRDALVNTKVRKYFPGYGIFTGVITLYYPITDTYHLLFEDGDEETDS
jgi:hypothetical protein